VKYAIFSESKMAVVNIIETRAKDVLLNINRTQAAESTLPPAATECCRPLLRYVIYSERARSIPSLPGVMAAQRVFVPGDLDL